MARIMRSSAVWIVVPFCSVVIGAPIHGDDENSSVRHLRTSVASRYGTQGGAGGGTRSRDYSDFERRYLPTPPPTTGRFQCNICSVPGTSVSLQESVEYDDNLITCQGLEQLSLNGNIPEDKCEEAQTLALSNCGCVIDVGFTSGDIASTCDPPATPLTNDEQAWLDLHNSRREFWHAFYEVDFEELCWDSDLASQAQYYADYLADECKAEHDQSRPDPNSYRRCRNAGENLAFDTRSGGTGRSAQDIVYAWTDNEYTFSFPYDGHMTQILWRPSRFLGCARATNSACRWKNIQVCRYVRSGNCNCSGESCRAKMLEDSSPCGTEEVTVTLDDYETCFENHHGI